MSARTLRALVVALAVVVALWAVVTFLSGRGGGGGAPPQLAGIFEGVSADVVTSVRLSGPAGVRVELRRDGPRWTANGWAADTAGVARFFSALSETTVGDLAASNPANHARMGVSADSAWTLELDIPSGTRTLLVGKPGPRYGTSYVRLRDADDVYLATGDLAGSVSQSPDAWRNKRVASVDTAAIRRIEVTRGTETLALVRADSAWDVEGAGRAGATVAAGVLAELHALDATGFVSPPDSLAGLPESVRVVALGAGGDTLAALTLGEGTGDRWLRARGDSVLYRFPAWKLDRLAPTRAKAAGPETPP